MLDLLHRSVVRRRDHRQPAAPASEITCGMPSPRDSQTKISIAKAGQARRRGRQETQLARTSPRAIGKPPQAVRHSPA